MLIAEIGNNHFGNIKKAKELIRAAHDSGADLIKGQAFRPADIKTGSMPSSFYDMCAFNEDEYIYLIEYARELGNDMFYSIFSPGFDKLREFQKWQKVAGKQTLSGLLDKEIHDKETTIISVPKDHPIKQYEDFKRADFLYVCEYLEQTPDLSIIARMSRILGRQVGYSDHTIGIDACEKAVKEYGAHIVEKHFTLQNYMTYEEIAFRDTIHGVTPRNFEKLANILSEQE